MKKRERTLQSLRGLSVGDAFGEMFFRVSPDLIALRQIPDGQWRWTDDTHMALSIVDVLLSYGHMEQNALATLFARRYCEQPWRGYGGGAHRLLNLYAQGAEWQEEAPKLFNGGSFGNGAAMRAAPIGAYFADDPGQAAVEAEHSASVTHAHPEGRAGAMAVATAAAILTADKAPAGEPFLREVIRHVPRSMTRDNIEKALYIDANDFNGAVSELGTGQQVAAFDTVPFCLWIAAYHSQDFETALWMTVSGLGDRDTTCAIVGGMIAPRRAIPAEWSRHTESLPDEYAIK